MLIRCVRRRTVQPVLAYTDLADFLLAGGGTVGGAVALGGSVGFVVGSVLREARGSCGRELPFGLGTAKPRKLAECYATYAGVFGLGVVLAELTARH